MINSVSTNVIKAAKDLFSFNLQRDSIFLKKRLTPAKKEMFIGHVLSLQTQLITAKSVCCKGPHGSIDQTIDQHGNLITTTLVLLPCNTWQLTVMIDGTIFINQNLDRNNPHVHLFEEMYRHLENNQRSKDFYPQPPHQNRVYTRGSSIFPEFDNINCRRSPNDGGEINPLTLMSNSNCHQRESNVEVINSSKNNNDGLSRKVLIIWTSQYLERQFYIVVESYTEHYLQGVLTKLTRLDPIAAFIYINQKFMAREVAEIDNLVLKQIHSEFGLEFPMGAYLYFSKV